MTYKGYEAVIEFDEEAGVFHGEVLNVRDVITFQGKSVAELKKALKDSIEDYLEFCRERGEEPEKPFSGRFIVRLEPAQHRNIFIAAKRAGKSLNSWVSEKLASAAAQG